MHASNSIPLLHSLTTWLAYAVFQVALVLAYVLHSAATLRSPFQASEETADQTTHRIHSTQT